MKKSDILEKIQHHSYQLEKLQAELELLDGTVLNSFVDHSPDIIGRWFTASQMYENFKELCGDSISKAKLGRMMSESERFIRRQGKKGAEWMVVN